MATRRHLATSGALRGDAPAPFDELGAAIAHPISGVGPRVRRQVSPDHRTVVSHPRSVGRRLRRALLIPLASILGLAAVLALCAAVVWRDEIRSLLSFREVRAGDPATGAGTTYAMDIAGDYYFDDFLAQGGVSSDEELVTFLTRSITRGLYEVRFEPSAFGCSAFTAATADGHRILARNYDLFDTTSCLVSTKPGGGCHASISTVDLLFFGIDPARGVDRIRDRLFTLAAPYAPVDGMNDAGVACAILATGQGDPGDGNALSAVPTDQRTDRPDLTSTTLVRLILDCAGSVDEAIELARSYDLHDSANASFHYLVADATGASAVLEWVGESDATDNDGSARELVVTRMDDDAPLGQPEADAAGCQWLTNFVIGVPGYYDSGWDVVGRDRYDYIGGLLSDGDGSVRDVDRAMEILAATGVRQWNSDHGLPQTDYVTVHSVVYDLTDGTARWVPAERFEDSPIELALEPPN